VFQLSFANNFKQPQTSMDELAQTLRALQSVGPERSTAEQQLNARIAASPAETLLGLTTGAATWPDEALRTFALVLVRRLAFKAVETSSQSAQDEAGAEAAPVEGRQVWDQLAESARAEVQVALLSCLERAATRREVERHAICDTVAEVQNATLARQGESGFSSATPLPYSACHSRITFTHAFYVVRNVTATWPQLGQALSVMFQSEALALREATFRIYSQCIALLEAEPAATAVHGLTAGLGDDSVGVRLSALAASCALLQQVQPNQLEQYAGLVVPMLQVNSMT
jgi:hypothetical protein